MNPRPLSPEGRKVVQRFSGDDPSLGQSVAVTIDADLFHALLAAEQYWRLIVKNLRISVKHDASVGEYWTCPVCRACDPKPAFKHKPDCPWLIANQECQDDPHAEPMTRATKIDACGAPPTYKLFRVVADPDLPRHTIVLKDPRTGREVGRIENVSIPPDE